MNRSILSFLLTKCGVNHTEWGKNATKTFDDLLEELAEGETTLEIVKDVLVRTVHVACVHIYFDHPERGRLKLYEVKQIFQDGAERERDFPQSVSEKFKADEEAIEAGLRGVEEEIQVPREAFSTPDDIGYIEQPPRKYSPSYPGLESQYKRFHFEVILVDSDYYRPEGYVEDDGKKRTFFEWRQDY